MAKFLFTELITPNSPATAARLGSASGSANYLDDKEIGKFVKLGGDSRYNLCAAGDEIEGFIVATEPASVDDFSFGSVQTGKGGVVRKGVVLDGLQATPGTGAIAIGDYVVTGTVVAKGTALSADAKVCKATTQADAKNTPFAWRLVSASGSAVGSTGVIEKA